MEAIGIFPGLGCTAFNSQPVCEAASFGEGPLIWLLVATTKFVLNWLGNITLSCDTASKMVTGMASHLDFVLTWGPCVFPQLDGM